MKKIIYITMCMALLSSCHIYRNYQRPEGLPVDSLFQNRYDSRAEDSLTLGDIPWQEIFRDTLLQDLIFYGLENNTDMQTAMLRVDQAKAQLKAARLSFLPSLTLSPQGALT
ncbi:TolC family protein, partial [Bacteroides salyersiae]